MDNVIEKIHTEFDSAVYALVKIANKHNELANNTVIPGVEENAEYLVNLGFVNVPISKVALKTKQTVNILTKEISQNKHIAASIEGDVNYYNKLYPFHKFILYSQVIHICEKYNLYLGHSSLFKGEIPLKNINELRSFNFSLIKDVSKTLEISTQRPLCMQQNARTSNDVQLYICAPLRDFEKGKQIYRTEKEIYKNEDLVPKFFSNEWYEKPAPKDPIILMPCKSNLGEIGFIIITKWGKEANDESLAVPILN